MTHLIRQGGQEGGSGVVQLDKLLSISEFCFVPGVEVLLATYGE